MSKKLHKLLKQTIPPGANVLYIGCKRGKMLHSLRPKKGVGIDANPGDIYFAKRKYAHLDFYNEKIINFKSKEKFDYVIIDEVFHYIDDVSSALKKIRSLCTDKGKLIMSSPFEVTLTRSVIDLFAKKNSRLRNWIPRQLLESLMYLSDFWPRPLVNSCLVADAIEPKKTKKLSYSIIIPAYNEEGNIANCINRVPDMKRDYEIIVVNDGSSDNTANIVKDLMKTNKRLRLVDYRKNRGKGYATKKGLDAGKKDVLMILDADMTVKPEDLPLFIEPFESRQAEFVNGTRLVYPMQSQAMRGANKFGNKVFSIIFSYLLNQKVTDTLCGTKCMYRTDYKRIVMQDDSWPDFDMLFGAAKRNLKIVEIPIWYQDRVAGESKMKVIKHGYMLLKATARGFFELKL